MCRAAAALVAAAFFFSATPAGQSQDFPLGGIGRLIFNDGHNLCTGWVAQAIEREVAGRHYEASSYWELLVATAGHCARGEHYVFSLSPRAYFAGVRGYSSDYDVAVLEFRASRRLPALPFGETARVGERVVLIGYGRRALLPKVGTVMSYDEQGLFSVDSVASPGNSGGPVISLETGHVVGLGVLTTLRRPPEASAIYCAMTPCASIAPYWAAPATWLRRLVRWEAMPAQP